MTESESTGGEPADADLPESVAINYYTAEGVNVTQESIAAAAAGVQGQQQQKQDGSGEVFVWDQQALGAKPTKFVFSPEAPQLSVSD